MGRALSLGAAGVPVPSPHPRSGRTTLGSQHLVLLHWGDIHPGALLATQEGTGAGPGAPREGIPGLTGPCVPPPQHQHHYLLLSAPLHLRPGPCERLVRELGPVSTLECAQEAGPLPGGRGGRGGGGARRGLACARCKGPPQSHLPLQLPSLPTSHSPSGARPA